MALTAEPGGQLSEPPEVPHVTAFAAVKNVIVKRNFNILFNRKKESVSLNLNISLNKFRHPLDRDQI